MSFECVDARTGSALAKHYSLRPISMASQLIYYLALFPSPKSSVLRSLCEVGSTVSDCKST